MERLNHVSVWPCPIPSLREHRLRLLEALAEHDDALGDLLLTADRPAELPAAAVLGACLELPRCLPAHASNKIPTERINPALPPFPRPVLPPPCRP